MALVAGPLGCLVVWRRLAYFGDAIAHAAILGVALGIALSTPVFLGVLAVSLSMAFTVAGLSGRNYAMDTLLGVLAQSALAFGLVAVSMQPGVRMDLMGYLFGDILAVGRMDLAVIWSGVIAVLVFLSWRWRPLLVATLNADLAHSVGVHPRREQLILTLTLAIVVAISIKVIGALLIAALLIIPAATARRLANSPESMAGLAAVFGVLACLLGIRASYVWDLPTGPMIVSVAALGFAISNVLVSVLPKMRLPR